jgi:hypothetical protein
MQAAADYPSLTKEQRLDILVRFSTSSSQSYFCAGCAATPASLRN